MILVDILSHERICIGDRKIYITVIFIQPPQRGVKHHTYLNSSQQRQLFQSKKKPLRGIKSFTNLSSADK